MTHSSFWSISSEHVWVSLYPSIHDTQCYMWITRMRQSAEKEYHHHPNSTYTLLNIYIFICWIKNKLFAPLVVFFSMFIHFNLPSRILLTFSHVLQYSLSLCMEIFICTLRNPRDHSSPFIILDEFLRKSHKSVNGFGILNSL